MQWRRRALVRRRVRPGGAEHLAAMPVVYARRLASSPPRRRHELFVRAQPVRCISSRRTTSSRGHTLPGGTPRAGHAARTRRLRAEGAALAGATPRTTVARLTSPRPDGDERLALAHVLRRGGRPSRATKATARNGSCAARSSAGTNKGAARDDGTPLRATSRSAPGARLRMPAHGGPAPQPRSRRWSTFGDRGRLFDLPAGSARRL
jgi:hypothetical protein